MKKNFLAQFFSQSKLGEKAFQYADRLKVKGRVGNTLETWGSCHSKTISRLIYYKLASKWKTRCLIDSLFLGYVVIMK